MQAEGGQHAAPQEPDIQLSGPAFCVWLPGHRPTVPASVWPTRTPLPGPNSMAHSGLVSTRLLLTPPQPIPGVPVPAPTRRSLCFSPWLCWKGAQAYLVGVHRSPQVLHPLIALCG